MIATYFPAGLKLVGVAVLLGWTSAAAQTTARGRVVWQIGTFDGSSSEFAKVETRLSAAAGFRIGVDQAATSWAAEQPLAGAGAGPRTIHFTLDQSAKPDAVYGLRVAFLIERAGVPAIRVAVNGRSGLFYLEPKLDDRMGDSADGDRTGYSQAEMMAQLPAGSLQAGDNTISLEPVADADEVVPDAGLNYDALDLEELSGARPERPPARIRPTIYYQRSGEGLKELVDVFVPFGSRFSRGQLNLEVEGRHYSADLHGGRDFGEERVEFAVPEFSGSVQAAAVVTLDSARQDFTSTIAAARKWTLFVVPHIHLDIGYTDYQAKVGAIQAKVIEEALDLTAAHPEYRFSTDAEWSLEQFWNTRSEGERRRVVEALRNRTLFVPVDYANLLTGFPTAETLVRSLYPAASFSREHGTPFEYASLTDVPSYSWSYASILASAGVSQLVGGSNNDRGPILLRGQLHARSPFWWEGPDGKRVMVWYARAYRQVQMLFGLPPLIEAGRQMLPVFLQTYDRAEYRPDSVILYGTQGENRDLHPQQAELVEKWNRRYAYPRMQYAGFHDALTAIAGKAGADIPVFRGDGGPYWEDGIGSDALYAALERANEAQGVSAEKLAAVDGLIDPRLRPDQSALDRMWKDMVLMDEHTWTASSSVTNPDGLQTVGQTEMKEALATDAQHLREQVVQGSMAHLAQAIDAEAGSWIVFNTLNWRRNGRVTVEVPPGEGVVDAVTGQAVPTEALPSSGSLRRIRFVAQDVPALGYKVYRQRRQPARPAPSEAKPGAAGMENSYYRIELDPSTGAVRSVFDKELGRELVDLKSDFRFGEYCYVTGGDEKPNNILRYDAASSPPRLEIHHPVQGRLISIRRTTDGWSARMLSQAVHTPKIESEIRLFDREKKIELSVNVEKPEVRTKEGVYIAFPFALDRPQFQYEIQNGVVDPAKDTLPGAGHEWFSVQHWLAVQQNGIAAAVVSIDASLFTLGDINRGAWPTEFGDRKGAVFSYVMNNYWTTNYRGGQGGNFQFRYVITSAPSIVPTDLSRLGWEAVTPLEVDEVRAQEKSWVRGRPLDGKQGSFLTVDDLAVLLQAWKPAEDGRGTILRFLDLGGPSRSIAVDFPLAPMARVWRTDAVERDGVKLVPGDAHHLQFEVNPHEMVTLRIETEKSADTR